VLNKKRGKKNGESQGGEKVIGKKHRDQRIKM
jgi:hypothetical protein